MVPSASFQEEKLRQEDIDVIKCYTGIAHLLSNLLLLRWNFFIPTLSMKEIPNTNPTVALSDNCLNADILSATFIYMYSSSSPDNNVLLLE